MKREFVNGPVNSYKVVISVVLHVFWYLVTLLNLAAGHLLVWFFAEKFHEAATHCRTLKLLLLSEQTAQCPLYIRGL